MTDWTTPRYSPAGVRRHHRLRSVALDREAPLRRLDWILLVAVLALCALGTVLVWSATRDYNLAHGLDPQGYLKKDILNIVVGLVLGALASFIDYRAMRAFTPLIYLAACVLLVVVLIPHIGATINGSHSWIPIGGGFEIQPSEFAKVALILMLAMLLGEKRDGESVPRDGDIVLALVVAAVPMGFVMLQPDLGTVMVVVFVVLGMLAVGNAPTRWVLGLVVVGVIGAFLVAHFHVLKHYQVQRLTAFAHPNAAHSSYGYQTAQARITIGSGGLTGKGLFHGSQTNGHFVPEQQTDFIFTVAGEELGLMGAGVIVVLTGIVLWRAFRIAGQASDMFGTLVASGIGCWLAFQAFENIGMSTGIMPLTGLPLPFLSYGGSSMFAALIAVGLLQNIHMRSSSPLHR